MIQIPEQVKDAPIVRMKNAVLVGTMKFTLDRFDASFDAEENPAPPRLAAQLAEFRASYDALNAAYALTRESLITQDIAALDEEGDQLYLGLKETVEGARRMTYMPARKEAGDRLMVFLKSMPPSVTRMHTQQRLRRLTALRSKCARRSLAVASRQHGFMIKFTKWEG